MNKNLSTNKWVIFYRSKRLYIDSDLTDHSLIMLIIVIKTNANQLLRINLDYSYFTDTSVLLTADDCLLFLTH